MFKMNSFSCYTYTPLYKLVLQQCIQYCNIIVQYYIIICYMYPTIIFIRQVLLIILEFIDILCFIVIVYQYNYCQTKVISIQICVTNCAHISKIENIMMIYASQIIDHNNLYLMIGNKKMLECIKNHKITGIGLIC